MVRHSIWTGAAALLAALLLLSATSLALVQFTDEDKVPGENPGPLGEEAYGWLYAYAEAWCNNGQPRSYYTNWDHSHAGSWVAPAGYGLQNDTAEHQYNGGWTKTIMTDNGDPTEIMAHASIPALPPIQYCPT